MKGPWTKASISVSMAVPVHFCFLRHCTPMPNRVKAPNKRLRTNSTTPKLTGLVKKMVLTHLAVIQRFTVPESQVTKISFCTVCKLERQVGVAVKQTKNSPIPTLHFSLGITCEATG